MDARFAALERWLSAQFPGRPLRIAPASADASFRRYWRVAVPDGPSRIAMDAPPGLEDCRPFVRVAALFGAAGVHVPEVFAQDFEQGFLLLEDLGDATYLERLTAESADTLYAAATDALLRIQLATRPGVLPEYDRTLLQRELRLFPDWYVARSLGARLTDADERVLDSGFDALLSNILAQPRTYVHRDYHSRNLMVCERLPGVLDFQDAVHGPLSYDLVSLFRDAYLCWDEERVLDWVVRYWEKARKAGLPVDGDFAAFYRDFEWMGVQRQFKVIGIFARLHQRDGKARYLDDIPRVLGYLLAACRRYRELGALAGLIERLVERAPSTESSDASGARAAGSTIR